MQLTFIDSTIITTDATNPTAVHMPDNSIWGFRVEDGRLEGSNIQPGPGDVDWGALSLAEFAVVASGENVSIMRIKHFPRIGTYGVWHQDATTIERHILGLLLSEQIHAWNNDFMRGFLLGLTTEKGG